MEFKKNFNNIKAQSIVEYVLVFTVLVAGVIAAFLAFNPDNVSLRGTFNQAISDSIDAINK
ncbi:MAG: hypothetical protein NTY47_05400 [Candidatus Omnitrophica bacterium]|nr:hypothetical protein [Candidatus Omnitrophota bacterium]